MYVLVTCRLAYSPSIIIIITIIITIIIIKPSILSFPICTFLYLLFLIFLLHLLIRDGCSGVCAVREASVVVVVVVVVAVVRERVFGMMRLRGGEECSEC